MQIRKVPSGVDFIDRAFGGLYAGHGVLLRGRHGTGKTLFSLHFLQAGLRHAERCLLLTNHSPGSLSTLSDTFGFNDLLSAHGERLILLEFEAFQVGEHTLGPDYPAINAFTQMVEIAQANRVRRIVFDSLLPWILPEPQGAMHRHVLSFIRACNRLDATFLMTLPKPTSPIARELASMLEANVPVALHCEPGETPGHFTCQTRKFLGARMPAEPFAYQIRKDAGIIGLVQ